jgi:predicted GTPase
VDRWWFKNLKSIAQNESVDEMREIVKGYRPGSLLREDSPELLSLLDRYGADKNLRILVFGPSNAGKSSLINGLFTALENTDIQYYRCMGGVEKSNTATTILPRANYIRLMEKGKVVTKISFVDSRGIVNSAKMKTMEEILQLLLGNQAVNRLNPRPGDELIGKNSSIVLPPDYRRFHLGICVIPADQFDPSILDITKKIFGEFFPVLFVVTRIDREIKEGTGDKPDEEERKQRWASRLNVHQEEIFELENYNVESNNIRNEKTDRKLLHILLAAIRKAELEGFQALSKDQVVVAADSLQENALALTKRMWSYCSRMDFTHLMALICGVILFNFFFHFLLHISKV